jgi:hypothetical protein
MLIYGVPRSDDQVRRGWLYYCVEAGHFLRRCSWPREL